MIRRSCCSTNCPNCGVPLSDHPLAGSVGAGGANIRPDVLLVQQLLNAIPTGSGGPDVPLDEDGLIGPKTRTAIAAYQQWSFGWSDGRVDPTGPTLQALLGDVVGDPAVPMGKVGLPLSRPNSAKGAKGTVPEKKVVPEEGKEAVMYANANMRVMADRLGQLRFRLSFQSPATLALLTKHFATKKEKVTGNDAAHVHNVVSAVHFQVARKNAFGAFEAESVLAYDPVDNPKGVIAHTVRGGNKMSSRQVQIYVDHGVVSKNPGHTVWLTKLFAEQPTYEKHWTLLHEYCHYVGPRDGLFGTIDDLGYAFDPKFTELSKHQRMHNAESLSLFMLEFCVGTQAMLALPRVSGIKNKYDVSPRVTVGGDIVP